MSTVPADLMTVPEVAIMLGVTIQRAHQLIQTYEVPFERVGNMKLVKSKDAKKLASKDRPSGVHVTKKKRKSDE